MSLDIKWDGGNRAFYRHGYGVDDIHMPDRASFHGVDELYSTLFHECTHSTGHPKRLNRPSLVDAVKFGATSYAKEELVAEMGAAFLCAMTGIENTQVRLNTVAYLKGWRDKIAKDPRLIVTAASLAQASTDYILAGAKVKAGMPAEEADHPAEEPTPSPAPAPKSKPTAKPKARRKGKAKVTPKSSASTPTDPEPVARQFLNGHSLPPTKEVMAHLRRSSPYAIKESGWWSDGALLVSLDALAKGTAWAQGLPARLAKLPTRRDARTVDVTPILQSVGPTTPGPVIDETGTAETYAPKRSIHTVTVRITGQPGGISPVYNAALVSILVALRPAAFTINARRLLVALDVKGRVIGLMAPILNPETKTNPGTTEMVGLGRLTRCVVRLPDGRRAALTPTGSPFLAWEPTRKRLAVLYPDPEAAVALPITGTIASRHAHFHGAAPSAGVSMLDHGPVGSGWRNVGLLESVTYHRAKIVSPARGEADWMHQFGDRGEKGHLKIDAGTLSRYPEKLMPMLLVDKNGSLAINRRKWNRYYVRDWIIG